MRPCDRHLRRYLRRCTAAAALSIALLVPATVPATTNPDDQQTVALSAIQTDPQQFFGRTVEVHATVRQVLGPWLFTVSDIGPGNDATGRSAGHMLVAMPSTLAAMVREGDSVTISGVVRPFTKSVVHHEWSWLEEGARPQLPALDRPVLVAERIAGGRDDLALSIKIAPVSEWPVGGTADLLRDLAAVAAGGRELIGRALDVEAVTVSQLNTAGGFFVGAGGGELFVLPVAQDMGKVAPGDRVHLQGVVMQMPQMIQEKLRSRANLNPAVYVFATLVDR